MNKGLKISHTTRMMKEGRKSVSKHKKNSNKIRHHTLTFKRSSSKCQYKEKSPTVKSYNMKKEIKTKVDK